MWRMSSEPENDRAKSLAIFQSLDGFDGFNFVWLDSEFVRMKQPLDEIRFFNCLQGPVFGGKEICTANMAHKEIQCVSGKGVRRKMFQCFGVMLAAGFQARHYGFNSLEQSL